MLQSIQGRVVTRCESLRTSAIESASGIAENLGEMSSATASPGFAPWRAAGIAAKRSETMYEWPRSFDPDACFAGLGEFRR